MDLWWKILAGLVAFLTLLFASFYHVRDNIGHNRDLIEAVRRNQVKIYCIVIPDDCANAPTD